MSTPLAINKMLGLLQAQGKRLDTLERYAASARFIDYTPSLVAATVNPTLGTGSSQTGRYVRIGNWVYALGDIRFGTAGAAAGTGAYSVTLPVARTSNATLLSDMVAGHWRCIGTAGAILNVHDVIVAAGSVNLGGRYPAAYPTGADTVVAATVPWTWTNNFRISFWVMYEAEE